MTATPAIVLPAIIPTDDFREFWTLLKTLVVGVMKIVAEVAELVLIVAVLAAEVVVVLITPRTTE
jgi:hypothetical protein